MIRSGDIFGIYTVIKDTGKRRKDGHKVFLIECNICHKQFERSVNKFAYKKCVVTKCMHDISNSKLISSKRLSSIYRGMYARCYNPRSKNYRIYGGRGIYICNKWLKNPKLFEKWAKKNGYEKNLTIDRIDGNGPYAPWNCRWVTINDNAKFRTITNVFKIDDIIDSGHGWSRRLNKGTNYINTMNRKYGKAFTTRYINETYHGFKILKPKNPNLFKY